MVKFLKINLLYRSSMSGGQRQSSACAEKRGVWTHTHSAPRQPRKSNAQGTCPDAFSLFTSSKHIILPPACSSLCVLSAAVPEDGDVAFTVQSAHGEAALVQSALPAHRSLSVPSTVQGAVRLWGRAAAGDHTLMILDNMQTHTHYFISTSWQNLFF